jgi:hypothetical protein
VGRGSQIILKRRKQFLPSKTNIFALFTTSAPVIEVLNHIRKTHRKKWVAVFSSPPQHLRQKEVTSRGCLVGERLGWVAAASFSADPRPAVFATMRQLAAAALAFAYAGGALAFAPAPSSLPATRSPSLRSAGVSLAPQARPTVSLGRKGRAALRMVETMEGRHLPQIIQGGMGVQVRLQK